jgi:hypothetical protein
MKEKIDKNIDYLSQLTKEESDFIEHILKWDEEQKISFILAKRIFEEDLNANEPKTE